MTGISRLPATVTLLALVGLLALLPISAAAQEAEATPPAERPWQVAETRELAVDGELVALSPDGTRIAGVGPGGGEICVWEVDTLDATCAGDGLDIQRHPLSGGIAWAPNSAAVAFIAGDWQEFEPTEVMVFEIERERLRNLTRSGFHGRLLIHTGPAWTSDSARVVFGQTDPTVSDAPPGEIIVYHLDLAVAVPIPLEDEFSIYAPVVVMPDDSVLFRVDLEPMGTSNAGIWQVDPDGSDLEQVLAGEEDAPIDRPVVTDVSADGAWLVVASETAMARRAFDEAFSFVQVSSGEVRPIEIDEEGEVVSQPVFAPGVPVALVQDDSRTGLRLVLLAPASGEVLPVEGITLPESWLRRPPSWAPNGQVLIPTDSGGLMLTVAPQGAYPDVTPQVGRGVIR